MAFSDLTYSITSGATDIPVTPLISDLVFTGQEDEELGSYVRRIATEMVFGGSDFTTLYDNWEATGNCASLPFNVKLSGVTKYTGILRIGGPGIAWDISNCRARATIDPSGVFLCAKENWDTEFNILDNGYTRYEVQPLLGTLETIECTDTDSSFSLREIDNCLTAPSGVWTPYRNSCTNLGGGNFSYSTTWIREKVTIPCVSGSAVAPPGGWTLLTDNCPTDATFVRIPATDFSFDNSFFNVLDSYLEYYTVTSGGTSFDNGVKLNDILAGEVGCAGVTVRSQFFGLNPSGATPSGDVYDTAATYLPDVLIFQKSDVKRPDVSQNATIGNWTYNGLLSSLKEQFNIRWRLTADTLRIEHVSYFQASQGEDFSAAETIQGLNAYSGNDTEISRRERWAFMEDTYYGFRGQPIEYSDCVPYDAQEETVHDIGPVNNDVDFIQANLESVSDEGFVFVNAYNNAASGTYHIITTSSLVNSLQLLNGHMAIPSLLDNYHRHDRMLPTGTLNGASVTFESTQRRKRQVELRVQMSLSDFFAWDESQLVKTQIGWGKVVDFSYSCRTCTLTINVEHE